MRSTLILCGLLLCCALASPGCDLPDPLDHPCDVDGDCKMAIALDLCCACAVAVLASELEDRNDYVVYDPEVDYSDQITASCNNVQCAACYGPPDGAVCSEDQICELTFPEDV